MSITLNRLGFSVKPLSCAQWFHVSGLDYAKTKQRAAPKERALPKGFRPPTVISLLTKDTYKPGMKIPDVGKVVSAEYKNLSAEQLQKYKEKAEQIGKERKREFERLSESEKLHLYAKQDIERKIRKLRSKLDQDTSA